MYKMFLSLIIHKDNPVMNTVCSVLLGLLCVNAFHACVYLTSNNFDVDQKVSIAIQLCYILSHLGALIDACVLLKQGSCTYT